MKVCSKCGETGNLSRSGNGMCKACHAEYMREYRRANPDKRYPEKKRTREELNAYMREYKRRRREAGNPVNPRKPAAGTVYIVREDNTGNCKIGYTARPIEARLVSMQSDNSSPLTVMRVIESADAWLTEQELHQRFAHLWVRGEWFALTDKDLAQI